MSTATRSLAFAARSLLRQPGRAGVGILGIAAVGALLFDMLLLSRGLVVSFRELLDSVGFDVRILSSDSLPMGGARLANASQIARDLAALPEVAEAIPIRVIDAEAVPAVGFALMAIDGDFRAGRAGRAGRDGGYEGSEGLVINQRLADALKVKAGDTIRVRVSCVSGRAPLPPSPFPVAGVGEFPFDDGAQLTASTSWARLRSACGGEGDDADMLLVASREGHGADAAVRAIRRARPDLHPATNEEIVARMQQGSFSYFRQISAVLSTITLLFGFLLITVLLTVSVNQRLAEIAAVRALGFSRGRVAADVLWQSALLVGSGGLLAVPLGFALSLWLDRILKAMPGVPTSIHFFVFEPRALALHATLLVVTALAAAMYPIRLVAALPIAETLRNEVV